MLSQGLQAKLLGPCILIPGPYRDAWLLRVRLSYHEPILNLFTPLPDQLQLLTEDRGERRGIIAVLGDLGWVVDGPRLPPDDAVGLVPRNGEGLVDVQPHIVNFTFGLVGCQRMPGSERQILTERLPRFTAKEMFLVLGDPDPGQRHEWRVVFQPLHRGVVNRSFRSVFVKLDLKKKHGSLVLEPVTQCHLQVVRRRSSF